MRMMEKRPPNWGKSERPKGGMRGPKKETSYRIVRLLGKRNMRGGVGTKDRGAEVRGIRCWGKKGEVTICCLRRKKEKKRPSEKRGVNGGW